MSEPQPQAHLGDRLSGFLDGELDADGAAAVRAHVASCLACAAELRGAARARSWVRALPDASPPFGTYERLLRPRRRWAIAAATASAAASFVLVGVSAPQQHVTPALAPMVQDHAATASLGEEPVTELVPVSFQR